jgi:hypothetical protein
MDVYYGFSKLTEKAVRKVELVVYFENTSHNPVKSETWVKLRAHIVYTRKQTSEEQKDADGAIKSFTKYSYFIDEKPWYGDIDRVLEQNFKADENHIGLEERTLIRAKLKEAYFRIFNRKEVKSSQLKLHFEQ